MKLSQIVADHMAPKIAKKFETDKGKIVMCKKDLDTGRWICKDSDNLSIAKYNEEPECDLLKEDFETAKAYCLVEEYQRNLDSIKAIARVIPPLITLAL